MKLEKTRVVKVGIPFSYKNMCAAFVAVRKKNYNWDLALRYSANASVKGDQGLQYDSVFFFCHLC